MINSMLDTISARQINGKFHGGKKLVSDPLNSQKYLFIFSFDFLLLLTDRFEFGTNNSSLSEQQGALKRSPKKS